MRPGPLIAIDVVCLYLLLAPMVLFGIYVFFDWLSQAASERKSVFSFKKNSEKDPGLWTREEILAYLDRN